MDNSNINEFQFQQELKPLLKKYYGLTADRIRVNIEGDFTGENNFDLPAHENNFENECTAVRIKQDAKFKVRFDCDISQVHITDKPKIFMKGIGNSAPHLPTKEIPEKILLSDLWKDCNSHDELNQALVDLKNGNSRTIGQRMYWME